MFLFIFIDGIGIGPDVPGNVFAETELPTFQKLCGGRMVQGIGVEQPKHLVKAIDASLGIEGLPQSATGQTSLFTGVNGAQLEGMHISAYPTQALRDVIARYSILKQADDAGFKVTFANAFSDHYWRTVERRRFGHSASTWTNLAAGLPFRDFSDLERGEAVYWDITHEIAQSSYAPELQVVEAEEAGKRLAMLAASYDLVLYETFLPDLVGHRRLDLTPAETLLRIDNMLTGVLDYLPQHATLLITSDHGNIEDPSTKGHTYNPVPLIVWGPASDWFKDVDDLTGVTPAILSYLKQTAPANI